MRSKEVNITAEGIEMLELEYLRNEMNQRISYFYEHPHKVFGHLLLLWGGTLTLLSMSNKNFMEDIFLFFIVSTIFFISVIMIYSFSNRNCENVNQIFKIAAYITIFYERRSCIKEDNKSGWEWATFKMTPKEIGERKDNKKHNYNISDEYFICSLIATSMNFLFLLLFIFKFSPPLGCMAWPDFLMIFLCVCYIVVSIFLSKKIHNNRTLNPQKWFKTKKGHMKSFIEYAIEIGYYKTEDEVKEIFGEDFWNEIYK